MPKYSQNSLERLGQVDPKLIHVFSNVIRYCDHTILTGHRTEEVQQQMYDSQRSKVQWPNSKHNSKPSKAVDASPYPIPKNWGEDHWKDMAKFYAFAAVVQYEARRLGYKIRFGGDWDQDGDFTDQKFDDLVHFELVEA